MVALILAPDYVLLGSFLSIIRLNCQVVYRFLTLLAFIGIAIQLDCILNKHWTLKAGTVFNYISI